MRTTVTLESDLLETLRQVTSDTTKSKAVVTAIKEYLRYRQIDKIKTLKGKIKFDLSADDIRHAQR